MTSPRLYLTFAVVLVLCILSLPLLAIGWAINTAMAHLAIISDGVRRWGGMTG